MSQNRLLGRIVVVDHVDHATQLARKFKYSLRIVTLEGESLSPGGSISGGAFKNSSNLLGRRREIEELEWKVKAHAKAVDELLVSIEDLKKDRNECRTELEKSRAALQNAFIRQNTARLNIEAAQEKKDQTKAGVEDLKKEEIEIETQVLQIRKKRKRQSRSWNANSSESCNGNSIPENRTGRYSFQFGEIKFYGKDTTFCLQRSE